MLAQEGVNASDLTTELSDGIDGLFRPGDADFLNGICRVIAKHKKIDHPELLDQYLKRLEFNSDGVAIRFTPLKRKHRKVVLDPRIRFGQPRVEPCGYLVATLANAAEAEGSVEAAAWWYDVAKADVRIAVEYVRSLGSRRIA